MKRLKLCILCAFAAISIANAANEVDIYEPNAKNFRDGFEAGIKAIKFQEKTDGYQEKLITITKPFMLIYDIKNTPLHEALFLQVIAAREGFETHFTREFVSLGEFEREIDAKDAKDLIIRKYKVKATDLKILSNQKTIVTYPFLFDAFYKRVLNEAEKLGYIIKPEVLYTGKVNVVSAPVVRKKVVAKPIPSKKLVFKNPRAMSYTLNGSERSSDNYADKGLVSSQDYAYDKTITTKEGEVFVKVKGQNLYFSSSDIADIK